MRAQQGVAGLSFVLAVLAIAAEHSAYAKDFRWAVRVGNTGEGSFYSVAGDGAGNVLAVGRFSGFVDMDPGPGTTILDTASGGNMCLLRLDPSGQFDGVGQFGSPSWSQIAALTVDPTGHLYTFSSFTSQWDVDPSLASVMRTNQGGDGSVDAFVSKSALAGTFTPFHYGIQFSGATASDDFDSILVKPDGQGNVFVAGTFRGHVYFDASTDLTSAGSTDVYLAKLSAAGAISWVKQIGGVGAQTASALTVDPSGSVVLAGSFDGTTDFDGQPITSSGGIDAFVVKLDGSGNVAWIRTLGGATVSAVAVSSTGAIHVVGSDDGTTDFDPGAGTVVLPAGFFVEKMDGTGVLAWAQWMPGTLILPLVAVETDGSVNIAGSFRGAADFDPGPRVWNLTAHGQFDYDPFLLRLDASGAFVWAGSFGGTSSEFIRGIAVDPDGALYVVGTFRNTVDFDPGPGVTSLEASNFNGFILRLVPPLTPDVDQDGVLDATDNCPQVPNAPQSDVDGDLIGDACDPCPMDASNDPDADGVCGGIDNCPAISNPTQADLDEDGLGDACDACVRDPFNDADADEICGERDNCPYALNAGQADADHDGLGDACDICPADPGPQDSRVFARSAPGAASRVAHGPAGSLYWFGPSLDPGNVASGGDVVRLDAAGQQLWSTHLTHQTPFGAVDGPGNVFLASLDQPQAFLGFVTALSKVTPTGAIAWTTQIGTVSSQWAARVSALTADGAGNVYVFGSFNGTHLICGTGFATGCGNCFLDYVCSLDPAGAPRWVKTLSSAISFLGASVDATGGVYAAGAFSGSPDFDPGPGTFAMTSAGSTDGFLLRLDASGAFQWAARIGGAGADGVNEVTVGADGLAAVGQFTGTADLNPGSGFANLTSAGATDAFVLRLDGSGSFSWAGALGGAGADTALGVAVNPSGEVTTVGSFEGTADFDPGAGQSTLLSAGLTDGFVSILGPGGSFLRALGVGGSEADAARGVAVAGTVVYAAGGFTGIGDFDPGPGTFELRADGPAAFFAKMDAAACGDTDLDGACDADDNCSAVPNPDQEDGDCDARGDLCDCSDQDPSTYPQAPEVNDGVDNQCPGDPGSGSVDEVSGLTGFLDPADRNSLSWTAQGGATMYEVARSAGAQFDDAGCAVVSTAALEWMDPAVPPVQSCFFYLVRAAAPFPGSWGAGSDGVERVVCP